MAMMASSWGCSGLRASTQGEGEELAPRRSREGDGPRAGGERQRGGSAPVRADLVPPAVGEWPCWGCQRGYSENPRTAACASPATPRVGPHRGRPLRRPPPPLQPRRRRTVAKAHVKESEVDAGAEDPQTLAQAALAQAKKELEWAKACPSARMDEEVQMAEAKVEQATACLAGLGPTGARLRSARDRADALASKAADLCVKVAVAEEGAERFHTEAQAVMRQAAAVEAALQTRSVCSEATCSALEALAQDLVATGKVAAFEQMVLQGRATRAPLGGFGAARAVESDVDDDKAEMEGTPTPRVAQPGEAGRAGDASGERARASGPGADPTSGVSVATNPIRPIFDRNRLEQTSHRTPNIARV